MALPFTVWFSLAASVVSSALFITVGVRLHRRPVSPETRLANRTFAVTWYALAAGSLPAAGMLALHKAGMLPSWLHQFGTQLALLAIVVALWGMLSFLLYVYTGRRRSAIWIGVVYGVFYLMLQGVVAYYGPPDRLADDGWRLEALYRDDATGEYDELQFSQPITIAILLLLIGPQLGAAVAYAMLLRKVEEPAQRYRIAMVSGSIILWFGTAFVAGLIGLEGDAWNAASRLLSILAPLGVLLAYFPPARWRSRLGPFPAGEPARA